MSLCLAHPGQTPRPRARCGGGPNWYAYVNNDPINFRDAWGLMPASDSAAAAALGYWGGGGVTAAATETPAGTRILQVDPGIAVWQSGVNVMATQGCFFMACLGVAQTATSRMLTAGQIQALVTATQASGAVEANMWVNEGRSADVVNAAFQLLGTVLTASIVGGTDYTGPADASLVGGITARNNPHWREADEQGNVVWDPYGAGNVTFQPGLETIGYVYFVLRRD